MKHCEIRGTPIGFIAHHFRCNFDWTLKFVLGQPKVYRKRDVDKHGGFIRNLGDNSLNLNPPSSCVRGFKN